MKYEESVANINKSGKQSVCLQLHPVAKKFLELLLEEFEGQSLFPDTSGVPRFLQLIVDAICVIAGQCCEADYIITTDEDEEHDFAAFKEVMEQHGNTDLSEEEWQELWKRIKPLTTKEYVTWTP